MKKFTLSLKCILFFAVLMIYANVHAQTAFFEDFENGIPGTWTLINNDGRTPNAAVSYVDEAWVAREDFDDPEDTVAVSTSWYEPVGAADDWLITPAIALDSGDFLIWKAKAQDPDYADGYEVRISTAGTAIADFMANPPLFTITEELPEWTNRQVNLAAAGYYNDTVYIAFRNNSNDKFLLLINDVEVSIPSAFDIAVNGYGGLEYPIVPKSQEYPAELYVALENIGLNPLTNIKVYAQLFKNNTLVHMDSVTSPVLTAGSTDTLLFSPIVPSSFGTGTYKLTFIAQVAENDTIVENNTLVVDTLLTVSDSTYARDNGIITNALGFNGATGTVGQTFVLYNQDTLSSVTFTLDNPTPLDELQASVYMFDGTSPTTKIAQTNVFTIPAAGTYTLLFPNGEILSPDVYFVALEQLSMNNMTLATTDDIYTPSTTFFQTTGSANWTPLEDASFFSAFVLRPNFGTPVTVGINQEKLEHQLQVYPNPSSGTFFLSISERPVSDYIITIRDVVGKEVKTLSLNNMGAGHVEVDLKDQPDGIYIISVQTADQVVNRRITLHK